MSFYLTYEEWKLGTREKLIRHTKCISMAFWKMGSVCTIDPRTKVLHNFEVSRRVYSVCVDKLLGLVALFEKEVCESKYYPT